LSKSIDFIISDLCNISFFSPSGNTSLLFLIFLLFPTLNIKLFSLSWLTFVILTHFSVFVNFKITSSKVPSLFLCKFLNSINNGFQSTGLNKLSIFSFLFPKILFKSLFHCSLFNLSSHDFNVIDSHDFLFLRISLIHPLEKVILLSFQSISL